MSRQPALSQSTLVWQTGVLEIRGNRGCVERFLTDVLMHRLFANSLFSHNGTANMDYEARKDDIAREIASQLAPEFGQDVVAETEKQLSSGDKGKRGFLPSWGSDAAAIAGIIIGAVQLVKQLYSESKTEKQIEDLKAALEARAPHPDRISAENRSKILQEVLRGVPKPDKN